VSELDEDNNEKSLTPWQVRQNDIPTPDLLVERVWIEPASPEETSRYTIKTSIKNRGLGKATAPGVFNDIDCLFYFGNQKVGQKSFHELNAGQSMILEVGESDGASLIAPKAGNYNVRVIVDANRDVVESDESNNDSRIDVTVRPPTLPRLFISNIDPATDEIRRPGEPIEYKITVTDSQGRPIQRAVVSGRDDLSDTTYSVASPTDAAGQTTYSTSVPIGRAAGMYSIWFIASNSAFNSSGPITRKVRVVEVANKVLRITDVQPASDRRKIRISYHLSLPNTALGDVKIDFSRNGGASFDIAPGNALSGDLGTIASGSHEIFWDAAVTLAVQTFNPNFKARIMVATGGDILSAVSEPFVVDIQGLTGGLVVQGKVRDDQTRLPISASVKSGTATAQTDGEGNYSLVNVSLVDDNKIIVSAVGYLPQSIPVQPSPGTRLLTLLDVFLKKPAGQATKPVVSRLKGKYEGTFLADLKVLNEYSATIDWNGASPGTVRFYANDQPINTNPLVGSGPD
jgi:hypothetical protein